MTVEENRRGTLGGESPIYVKHLLDFMGRVGSEHYTVNRAIGYSKDLEAAIKKHVECHPDSVKKMARDAMECLMFGMRNLFHKNYRAPDRTPFWQRIMQGSVHEPLVGRIRPEATRLYLALLFDAGHNLPAIQDGTFSGDPAHEIAGAAAFLRLHHEGRLAVEMRFDWLLDKRF